MLAAVYNDNQDHSFIHGCLHAKQEGSGFHSAYFAQGLYLFHCHIIFYQRETKESFIGLVHNDSEDHLFIQDYLHANTLSLMHTAVLTCMLYQDNVLMFTSFSESLCSLFNFLIYSKGSLIRWKKSASLKWHGRKKLYLQDLAKDSALKKRNCAEVVIPWTFTWLAVQVGQGKRVNSSAWCME